MVPASDLKSGTILQIEKNLYQVLATEYHMGCGKMSSLQDEVYKPAALPNGMQI
jgi:translation elongation factor P/translation initiation factor 5A